jgi:hypothetical protein
MNREGEDLETEEKVKLILNYIDSFFTQKDVSPIGSEKVR